MTAAFTHTGWHIYDGTPVYLHSAGAIGASGPVTGIDLRLDPIGFSRFELPDPPDGDELKDAVHASLSMLGVASAPVSVALLAMAYRAPLGQIDFSGFLVGPTGGGKSELAALVQQHYGATMDSQHLPAAWSWTTNALSYLAFRAKDAVLVIDDLWPISGRGVNGLHRDAALLLSGQDAGSTRSRKPRPPMPPRALILATGEILPRVEWLSAHLLALEIGPSEVSWHNLTMLQEQARAGKFAAAMAGYLRWLAPTYEHEAERVRSRVQELRQAAIPGAAHPRTVHMIANLAVGLERFLQFAEHVGAVDASYRREVWRRGWLALVDLGEAQARHFPLDAKPVRRPGRPTGEPAA
ncbi:MAG TPA: hypothetical protein VOB72_07575 [Candidatus Dormibacteraeota bacterium]|nr:hypothetical protein [Candidatus Dormibacteraeota bacterium]